MERAVPLGPEDRAILNLEGPTIAGHTCKVMIVEAEQANVDALRAEIDSRMAGVPQLTWRLDGSERDPCWIADPDFDLRRHVTPSAVGAPLDSAGLRVEVARLFEQRLDRRRPLWHMDVVPLRPGYALVWRIHHALADGTAAMYIAREVLWDKIEGVAARPRAHRAVDEARRRRHVAGFVERELSRSRNSSPFDGRIGRRRQVAFAKVPLGPLHDNAKAACGATVNDGVLAIVAGALRRWLAAHHESVGALRVKVPVSLHHAGDDAGNRDSFFCLSLPLGEADPAERLRAIKAETALRKAEHDAETFDGVLQDLGRISPRLRAFANRVQASPRNFALNISNVPGPRAPVSILGSPVTSVHSIAELAERHALRIAVVSVGGLLYFGFCSDPELLEDVQAMADGVEAEAALLGAGVADAPSARSIRGQ
jgi:diacylglycerol O-acyltransferase / wax synthase